MKKRRWLKIASIVLIVLASVLIGKDLIYVSEIEKGALFTHLGLFAIGIFYYFMLRGEKNKSYLSGENQENRKKFEE